MAHRTASRLAHSLAIGECSASGRIASSSKLAVRSIASSASRRAETAPGPSSPKKAYPFSPAAVVRNFDVEAQRKSANISPTRSTRGVMASLEAQLKSERDPTSHFTSLFHRKSPDIIPPGSVLVVETYTNASKTTTSNFAGVLIAVRRRGLATSFIVRNIVAKLGVEVRFNLYSPLLKDIKVVQRATAGKNIKSGGLRRARRAKLYYLRDDDRKLAGISKSVAALQKKEQAQRETAKLGRRAPVKDRR